MKVKKTVTLYSCVLLLFGTAVFVSINLVRPNVLTVLQYLAVDMLEKESKKGHLLIGSSSIKMISPIHIECGNIINRGINNAILPDLILYTSLNYFKREYDTVILYAGENDIAYGKSAREAIELFQLLVDNIVARKITRKIIILPIKLSPNRRKNWREFTLFNEQLNKLAMQNKHIYFSTQSSHTLNRSHFLSDGIHLNKKGYSAFLKEANNQCKKI